MNDNIIHEAPGSNPLSPQDEINVGPIDPGSVKEVMNELTGSKTTEQHSGFTPQVTQPTSSQPVRDAVMPTVPHVTPAVPVVPPTPPMPSTSSTPAIADDNDLIEKEWVLKAKAIVESTKDDPYVQNQQIGRYKADYMKKRFNKEIKVTES